MESQTEKDQRPLAGQTTSMMSENALENGEYPKFLKIKRNLIISLLWISTFASFLGVFILMMVDWAKDSQSLPESHVTALIFTGLISLIFFIIFIIYLVQYQKDKPMIITYTDEEIKLKETVLCPQCHKENKAGSRVCKYCGADLYSQPLVTESGYPERPYSICMEALFFQGYGRIVFFALGFLLFLLLTILGFSLGWHLTANVFFLVFCFFFLFFFLYFYFIKPLFMSKPKEKKGSKHAYHYYSDHLEEVTIKKTKNGEKKIQSDLYFRDCIKAKRKKDYYFFVGNDDHEKVLFVVDGKKMPESYLSILDQRVKEIISLNGK